MNFLNALFASTAALAIGATAVFAQGMNEAIIANLQDLGYEYIEIKNGPTQTKVEAVRGGTKIEVIYDNASGAILKQETEMAGDDAGKSGIEIKGAGTDFLEDEDDDRDTDDDHDDDGDDDDDDHDDDHDDEDDDHDDDDDDNDDD